MTRKRTSAGVFLVALAGMFAGLALLAAPAGAQVSGGAYAENGSVASGTADAHNNSTASGDATARNQSTASGCSTAVNQSTASGDTCPRPAAPAPTPQGGGGGGAAAVSAPAGGATPTAARLAFTGAPSAWLVATAALAMAAGLWMVVVSRRPERA